MIKLKLLLLPFFLFCVTVAFSSTGTNMKTLSEEPRVRYFPGFLSEKECDEIVKDAEPLLMRSTVVSNSGGEVDSRRTSYGMFFPQNPAQAHLKTLEKRIAELTKTPIENGEGFQVLRYGIGAEYQPHHDYFDPNHPSSEKILARGGQRVATMILYLNTPEKGGETIFPTANISVTPKKGDAVLFYNVNPSGKVDPKSLHGGSPVIAGEKWIMTKWIRENAFQ